jgi:hypothetical protein
MPEEQQIPEVSTEELLRRVEEGAELYSGLSSNFIQEKLVFYGQTLFEWANEMEVEIPDDLDEYGFRRKLSEIANKLQRANKYYSATVAMEETVSGGGKLTKNDIIAAIVKDYETRGNTGRGAKRPAASLIEQIADSYMAETVSTHIAAKIIKGFWRKRVETLLEVKSIVEQIGISLHVEAKHLTR